MLKYRSLISQLCAILPPNILLFVFGTFTGFHIILIGELHKNGTDIPTTIDELTWFASLDVLLSVGTIVTGALMHRLQSRLVTLSIALSFFGSYLLYHFSSGVAWIFASRVLSSLLSVLPLSGPYICEVSEPRLRGPFLAISILAVNVGAFFALLLGSFLHWRTIALIGVVFPIVTGVVALVTPNSPVWLANKGRLEEAEKALCWLRGWVKPERVQVEFHALVDSIESSSSNKRPDIGSIDDQRRRRPYLRRSFYVPLGTTCLTFLLHALCGVDVIESYLAVVFRELNSPIDESLATAIVGAMTVAGALIVLLLVRRVGRRRLVFFSVVVVGASHATVAIVAFFEMRCPWVSTIAVIVAFFANFSGIGLIVLMMVGEVFPPDVRYIGASICVSVRNILKSLMSKVFLYVVEALTLPGVFLYFASMNVVALVAYYFLFPETEGRSLKEIEDHFKGVEGTKEPTK